MDFVAAPLSQEKIGQVYGKNLEGLGPWMPIELIKLCSKCGETKRLEEFYNCKGNRDGKHGSCKVCYKKRVREHSQIPEVKARIKTWTKKYNLDSEVKIRKKAQSQTPKAKSRAKEHNQIPEIKARVKTSKKTYDKEYCQRPEVKARRRKRDKEKRVANLNFKIAANLRSRGNQAIKGLQKKGSFVDDLGCSIDKLRIYLESHFNSGMTWANWGKEFWFKLKASWCCA